MLFLIFNNEETTAPEEGATTVDPAEAAALAGSLPIKKEIEVDGDFAEIDDVAAWKEECSAALPTAICDNIRPGSIIILLAAATEADLNAAIAQLVVEGLVLETLGSFQLITSDPTPEDATTLPPGDTTAPEDATTDSVSLINVMI
jgi:hypothetical protein